MSNPDIYMEDVHNITREAVLHITTLLAARNMTVSDEQEDKLYEGIQLKLEELTGYPDFRSQN